MSDVAKIVYQEISALLGVSLSLEHTGETYEIEDDDLTLTFTADAEFIQIRNIDTHGQVGLGRKLVEVIHDAADGYGLSIIASMVRDEARGFWYRMGYLEGAKAGEFFRVT